jgi:hypothetical protein
MRGDCLDDAPARDVDASARVSLAAPRGEKRLLRGVFPLATVAAGRQADREHERLVALDELPERREITPSTRLDELGVALVGSGHDKGQYRNRGRR